MKTSRTERALGFLSGLLVVFILVSAGLAVRSVHHPNECEPKPGTAKIKDDQQIPETLGCPVTWAPITWFTAALVVVGGLQGILFWWQLGLIRDSAEDTTKAANAAGEQARTAREEFIATHRAKIIVRNMHCPAHPVLQDVDDDDDLDVSIVFGCINVGETTAVIEKIEAKIIAKHPKRPIATGQILTLCQPSQTILPPPQMAVTQICGTIAKGEAQEIHSGRLQICCIGCVQYKDGRAALRQTGFVRVYDPETGRFNVVRDREYEYSY